MDANRFDAFSRSLIARLARRSLLGVGIAGGLGALLDTLTAAAKKRRKKKKKRKKKTCKPACQQGEVCRNRNCVCPSGIVCSSGACCAAGQTCLGQCQACPVGISVCEGTTLLCGKTSENKPCACTTVIADQPTSACIVADLAAITCLDCDSHADCEAHLGLPAGAAVCIAGLDCPPWQCPEGKGCAIVCQTA